MNWKKLVGAVAPTLATALGGPLAGAAVAAVGKAILGKENATEDEIEAAVASASPEMLLRLKEADNSFKLEMEKLGVDLERIHSADRDSARRREVAAGDPWTPRVLSAVIISGFFACVGYVLAGKAQISGEAGVLVGSLIGYVSAKADQVVSYFFGSSAGSKAKTDALERMSGQK